MSDRKQVNKYYPPDWTPEHGSINKYVGQHPLRHRARKLDQGILIIRFELPFNIWCLGCGVHVGIGKRYNAEKKKIGMYYSTPILSFRMKCHECPNWFEIQTDPKNTEYVVTSGAKKKDETWDPDSIGAEKIHSEDTKEKLKNDPLYRVEHGYDDKQKSKSMVVTNEDIKRENDRIRGDSFLLDKMLRDKFRAKRQDIEAKSDEKASTAERLNLMVPIADISAEDHQAAAMERFDTRALIRAHNVKRHQVQHQNVLAGTETVAAQHTRALASGIALRAMGVGQSSKARAADCAGLQPSAQGKRHGLKPSHAIRMLQKHKQKHADAKPPNEKEPASVAPQGSATAMLAGLGTYGSSSDDSEPEE